MEALGWAALAIAYVILMLHAWWEYKEGYRRGYRQGYDDGDARKEYRPTPR